MIGFSCGEQGTAADTLLACVSYGRGAAPDSDLLVPMPVLPEAGLIHTLWRGRGVCQAGNLKGVAYRFDEEALFGVLRLEEPDFSGDASASALERATQQAYERVFDVLEQTGFPFLVRCWNYLPGINVHEQGQERYRQFNAGRQRAFEAAGRGRMAPAASALGTQDGSLVFYFLASRYQPQAIENPRQVSAWRYPSQYGSRSPFFSRATLLPLPDGEALFVSGTASIVGHESRHVGDVAAQTTETLRNIEAVVEEANRCSRLKGFRVRDLWFKIFVRNPGDFQTIRDVLIQALGPQVAFVCVHADVCRAELLVEIEALGLRSENG